jgi:NAD(P)-dependent dehydrogenase (short-subunit alcohol dehydrogenase family)
MAGGRRLQDKVAVVVGVGSVVGRAAAVAFAREGADVLAVDPDGSAAAAVAEELAGAGALGTALETVIDTEEGADAIRDACASRWDQVDVLMTCHAMLDHEPVRTASLAHVERVIKTNLLGPIACTQALFPLLCRSSRASVIYLTSIDGILGNPTFPAYSVSKGGLIPLTHVMAHDGAAHGIRVNAIAMAALIPTGSIDPAPLPVAEAATAAVLRATPLGRPARPEDVAGAAVYLASDDASYVTGVVLPVDGGRTAITPGTNAAAVVELG